MKHASHADIVKRLKRAEGHLRATIEMFAQGKSCLDLAQQLHAVESAVANAKREMIHDHIEHCLDEPEDAKSGTAALKELKAITKYL
ncbi:MAG: metal-sensing transcriptional repressor [Pseudolabrys sp.]